MSTVSIHHGRTVVIAAQFGLPARIVYPATEHLGILQSTHQTMGLHTAQIRIGEMAGDLVG